jgi:hypothetical protein
MCDDSGAGSKGAAGAPAKEIEITPEMIAAGAAVLDRELAHDPLMSTGFARVLSEEILRAAEIERLAKSC